MKKRFTEEQKASALLQADSRIFLAGPSAKSSASVWLATLTGRWWQQSCPERA